MTLEELYNEKLKLESDIYTLVSNFKKTTGLLPSDITLDIVKMTFVCGGTYSMLNNVTVDVEL